MDSKKNQQVQEAEVLTEDHNKVRTLILNRPKKLNALTFGMVSQLLKSFVKYEEDPNVSLVILKGKGSSFSTGGDVVQVVRRVMEGDSLYGSEFVRRQYTLDFISATYKKPQVSILDGLVMGGGVGASVHGSFRIATQNTIFAMPEVMVGIFPDVGASYFLSRLPGFFGEYVGLTGRRLDGADMLACGLATHYVSSKKLCLLEAALYDVQDSDQLVVRSVIDKYSENVPLKHNSSFIKLNVINKCFSRRTVEGIFAALEAEVQNDANDQWLPSVILAMKRASPLSLKVTLRLIREGRYQSIGQCLKTEYRITCHMQRKERGHDFFEGCRALLIDKDKKPMWEPSKLELISDEMVDCYFSILEDYTWHDWVPPTRPLTSFFAHSRL